MCDRFIYSSNRAENPPNAMESAWASPALSGFGDWWGCANCTAAGAGRAIGAGLNLCRWRGCLPYRTTRTNKYQAGTSRWFIRSWLDGCGRGQRRAVCPPPSCISRTHSPGTPWTGTNSGICTSTPPELQPDETGCYFNAPVARYRLVLFGSAPVPAPLLRWGLTLPGCATTPVKANTMANT